MRKMALFRLRDDNLPIFAALGRPVGEQKFDRIKTRQNEAKFETIGQLSERPRRGDPLPAIEPAQIAGLVALLELDKAASRACNLHHWIALFAYEAQKLFEELPSRWLGRRAISMG